MELLYNNTYYKFANNSLLEKDQESTSKEAAATELTSKSSITSIITSIASAFAKDVEDEPQSDEKQKDQNVQASDQQQQFILNLANSVHHIAEALKNIKFAHA